MVPVCLHNFHDFHYDFSAGHITGLVCQDELFFNLETGFCDQKEYVTTCAEADLVNLSTTSSSITEKVSLEPSFITAQQSYRSTCKYVQSILSIFCFWLT